MSSRGRAAWTSGAIVASGTWTGGAVATSTGKSFTTSSGGIRGAISGAASSNTGTATGRRRRQSNPPTRPASARPMPIGSSAVDASSPRGVLATGLASTGRGGAGSTMVAGGRSGAGATGASTAGASTTGAGEAATTLRGLRGGAWRTTRRGRTRVVVAGAAAGGVGAGVGTASTTGAGAGTGVSAAGGGGGAGGTGCGSMRKLRMSAGAGSGTPCAPAETHGRTSASAVPAANVARFNRPVPHFPFTNTIYGRSPTNASPAPARSRTACPLPLRCLGRQRWTAP